VLSSFKLKEAGVSFAGGLMVEIEREEDGRWIAEVPGLPSVLAYGNTPEDAQARAEALALRVMADRREHGEPVLRIAGPIAAVASPEP
jgi:predicted RNase H-like HicB family nuclease